jgi:hypothetical protein
MQALLMPVVLHNVFTVPSGSFSTLLYRIISSTYFFNDGVLAALSFGRAASAKGPSTIVWA